MEGIIKFLSDKGFGFVEVEGYPKGIFFHATACKDKFENLRKGDLVEVGDIELTEKGNQTNNIKLI